MTNHPTSHADVAVATARADAVRVRDGRPPRTRTSGPIIEMMLEAGCTVDTCRGSIAFMEVLRPDLNHVIGAARVDALIAESTAAVLAAEGLTVFEVDVVFTDRQRDAQGAFRTFRSRVSVAAADPIEAEWVGTALVMGQPGREAMDCMPVASGIVV